MNFTVVKSHVKMHLRFLALLFIVFSSYFTMPLEAQTISKYYIGGGGGYSFKGEIVSSTETYNSTLILMQGGINLTPSRVRFPLILKMETNLGISNLSTHGARDYEWALIVGFETVFPLSNKIALTASISTGPGYFNADIMKQSDGFIFSNNFSLTVIIRISSQGWYLKPEYRFRHMSSFDFRLPNYGLDHHFILLTAGVLFGDLPKGHR